MESDNLETPTVLEEPLTVVTDSITIEETSGQIDDNIESPIMEFTPSPDKYRFFKYDDTIDTSTIQNVLFINSSVTSFQQYANANTFPIVYTSMSTREKMLELLASKFTNISRIAIVCHFGESPYFLNRTVYNSLEIPRNEILFSDDNTQFIVDIIKQFNVLHMDYLACGTLNSQVWTSYYTKIHDATGIPIGASLDDTGNLKYGGDWILESTMEDVQMIYFNDLIQNYTSVLTLDTIVITSVLALNGKVSITYNELYGTTVFLKTQYSINNSAPWIDCSASSVTSSIITGLTNDISYSNYYIRTVDSGGNVVTGVLVPTFTPKAVASYVATSNFEFIYKMAKTVWDASTTKTYPFITTSGSFSNLSYSFVAVDSNTNMQVTCIWTSFTDTTPTTNNDGINCQVQKFNNVKFSLIPSFEITKFGGMPLSRCTTTPNSTTSIFGSFTGKISAIDAPKILSDTKFTYAFSNVLIPTTNFGNIAIWDTTNVVSMANTFRSCTNFNENVGLWNTSNVTSMLSMFYICSQFNQNVGLWNTSNVTSMLSMF